MLASGLAAGQGSSPNPNAVEAIAMAYAETGQFDEAARWQSEAVAIASRGGRPDLADEILHKVSTPTLLIVGGVDHGVIELNERALSRLKGPKALEIIPGASHLFPEPGALEAVIDHAARWFARHLAVRLPQAGSRG